MRMTEKQVVQRFRGMVDQYDPLIVNNVEEEVVLSQEYRVAAIVEFSVQDGPSFEALVEITPVATPKNILEKSRLLVECISKDGNSGRIPMIIAPYIGAKQAKILMERGISWLDLSGNMSIKVSNQVYIERTGKPNRFPDTVPIKKIFQGTSALVSRALLLRPEGFKSLEKIVDFINQRNANITISTVSKVVKQLDDGLLVKRSDSLISIDNPERLLEKLAEGYRNSTERKRRNSYRYVINNIKNVFLNFKDVANVDFIACGFYAAQIKGLAVTDQVSIFVRDMEQVQWARANNWIKFEPDTEFGNFSVTETNDPGVWFNVARSQPYEPVVDDIELYLEMMVETPRGPKIAEQLKKRILPKADVDGQKNN